MILFQVLETTIVLSIDHGGKDECRDTNQKSLALFWVIDDSGLDQSGGDDGEKWQGSGYILIALTGFLMD